MADGRRQMADGKWQTAGSKLHLKNAVSAAKHREVPLSHLLRDSLHHLSLKNRNGPNPRVIGSHGDRFSSRRGLVARRPGSTPRTMHSAWLPLRGVASKHLHFMCLAMLRRNPAPSFNPCPSGQEELNGPLFLFIHNQSGPRHTARSGIRVKLNILENFMDCPGQGSGFSSRANP